MRRSSRSLTSALLAATMLAVSSPFAIAASPAPQASPEAVPGPASAAGPAQTGSAQTDLAQTDPAQTEAEQAGTAQTGTTQPDTTAAAEDTDTAGRHCLRNTGSLITSVRNRRAEREGKPSECAPAFGRAYTSDDLRRTGGKDLGDILRTLDPSIR